MVPGSQTASIRVIIIICSIHFGCMASKDAVKTEADKKDKADNKSASDNKDKAAKADAGKEKSKEAVKAEPEETKPKKSAWEVAEEVLGKPEDNKKSWFPFFK